MEGSRWVYVPWAVIMIMIIVMSGVFAYAMAFTPNCGVIENTIIWEVNCTVNWWGVFKKTAQVQYYTLSIFSVVLTAAVAVREIFPNEPVRATTAVAAAVASGLLVTFKPDQEYQRYLEAESIVKIAISEYDHAPQKGVKGDGVKLWEARMLGETIIHAGSRYIKIPNPDGGKIPADSSGNVAKVSSTGSESSASAERH